MDGAEQVCCIFFMASVRQSTQSNHIASEKNLKRVAERMLKKRDEIGRCTVLTAQTTLRCGTCYSLMWALGRIQRCCSAAAAAAGATSLSATISPATLASLHAQQSLLAFSTTTTAAHHHHHHLLEPDAAKVQQQLLETALNHVKRLGWTKTALAAAATDMQLSPACVGMFPRGASHLVEHWIAGSNAALEAELQAAQQQYMVLPVRQRITAAVRRRLEMIAPHMDSWPQVGVVVGAIHKAHSTQHAQHTCTTKYTNHEKRQHT